MVGFWLVAGVRNSSFQISDFDAGVKWILHKPARNTRNPTSKKLLDEEVVSLV